MHANTCLAVFVSTPFAAQHVDTLPGQIIRGAACFADNDLPMVIAGSGFNGDGPWSLPGGACWGNVSAQLHTSLG